MDKRTVLDLPREFLNLTSVGWANVAPALSSRCRPEFGNSFAVSACSAVIARPPQTPTPAALNRYQKRHPLTPKAFQNIAEGQPRRAGAPPSDTGQPKPSNPETVPQWSPCCATRPALDMRLPHVISQTLLSAFTIQHSAFADRPTKRTQSNPNQRAAIGKRTSAE